MATFICGEYRSWEDMTADLRKRRPDLWFRLSAINPPPETTETIAGRLDRIQATLDRILAAVSQKPAVPDDGDDLLRELGDVPYPDD